MGRTHDIVIARFHESIDWIPKDWYDHVYLYDKEDRNGKGPNDKITDIAKSVRCYERLQNVGREAHTYLYHIIKHWEDMPDVYIFTQANPFDHAPKFIEKVNESLKSAKKKYTEFGSRCYNVDHGAHWTHVSLRRDMNSTLTLLFGDGAKWPTRYMFSAGAILMVTKEDILKRPKDFYEDCMSLVDKHIKPAGAYVLERFWTLIWNPELQDAVQVDKQALEL